MLLHRTSLFLVTVLILSLTAVSLAQAQSSSAPAPAAAPHVVEVVAVDYALEAPDAIPSGWTTLRFTNEGEEPHHLFVARLPEGKSAHDYESDLSLVFADVWNALLAGDVDQEGAMAMLGQGLPEWFTEVQFVGGAGVTAPGRTTEVTIFLEPGEHVFECYLKNADGDLHYMEGMLRPVTVTAQTSDGTMPAHDARVVLSNFELGIEGELKPGKRTIAVHFAEQPEGPFGHSLHIARLNGQATADEVVAWMNWLALDGQRTPAPATFVGGTHAMPAGQTAYVTVTLEPGRYLFVSEATGHLGVVREVTVR